jgi:glycerol kinase
MADKKKVGSKLLAALGKTKKEQMAKLYPKVKGDIRGKGPYLRGKVMGSGDFLKRRAAVAGTKATKAPKDRQALKDTVAIGAAALAGFGVGKYDSSKKSKAKPTKSHKGKAKQLADEAIKKQKAKKEKHHSR